MKAKKLENIDLSLYEFDREKGIYSKKWKRWCKGYTNNSGYNTVWLMNKDKTKMSYPYHRVMAFIFCQKPEELKDVPFEDLDVNHKNEIRDCNIADNLEWCTAKYNVNYGTGNKKRSDTNKDIKHTEEWNTKVADSLSKSIIQVKRNGEIVHWKSISECGRNGYTPSAVCQCCQNKYHNGRYYKESEWYYENE